ncbi:DUF3316 domain-containing protein [Vibrio nereis]|uniref:DUF3316 domain-containing protein n=1 Tax=Vibrio nereis TaxID=693 RepID=UPI002493DE2A|nr:DUF3316 domain-containing protein [Vibrio nereis]
MIKVLSLASLALVSTVSFAGLSGPYETRVTASSMMGQPVASKEAAFAAGRQMLMDVNNQSSYELSRNISFSTNDLVDKRSFEVLDSQVTVKEVMTSDGDIAYQPVMNIKYTYRYRDRD